MRKFNNIYISLLVFVSLVVIIATVFVFYFLSHRMTAETYPRLANYYLNWDITDQQAVQLAKWNLIVIAPQAEERHPGLLKQLKQLNPSIKILVYQVTQELNPNFITEPDYTSAKQQISFAEAQNLWLRDESGNFVSYWPTNHLINITKNNNAWIHYLAGHVYNEYFAKHSEYDGVFFDNLWYDISWLPNTKLDFDENGQMDDSVQDDIHWRQATRELLTSVEKRSPEKIVMGNVNFDFYDTQINGKMFENFGRNQKLDWPGLFEHYRNAQYGLAPRLVIINENTNGENQQNDYRLMRFALATSLLSDGYYSFDQGDCCHNNLWWYDEYSVKLGKAVGGAQRLSTRLPFHIWLPHKSATGIWKRVFENGAVYLNSSDIEQTIPLGRKYKKINGTQDKQINDGSVVSEITLKPNDAIILLNK